MGEHLYTYIDPPNELHLEQISKSLRNDALIALPMQTNWVFACDASSRKGLAKIQRLKSSHAKNRPYSIVCSSISMASSMGNIGGQKYRLLNRVWPGPFTMIFSSSRQLPKILKIKREKVGIRIPQEAITLALVEYYGKPLVVSSVPLTEDGLVYKMGYEIFERFGHGLDFVVDLGDELSGQLTTVIDMSTDEIEVIREGAGAWSLGT